MKRIRITFHYPVFPYLQHGGGGRRKPAGVTKGTPV